MSEWTLFREGECPREESQYPNYLSKPAPRSIAVDMDFRNVNPLNVRSNYISGNLLPLAPRDSQFSFMWKLYSCFTWLIQVAQLSVLSAGLIMVSRDQALKDGTLVLVLTIEVLFVAGQIQTNKKLVDRLILKLNNILRTENEMMKNIVMATLRPMETPLKCYSIAGSICVLVWFLLGFLVVFDKEIFFYEDFRMPVAFSKQPFSMRAFLLGCILIVLGNVFVFLKKCGLYIYMIHLVLMITAQYRYITKKLAAIFRDADKRYELGESSTEVNQWTDNVLRGLCRHHTTIVRLSVILREILSSSISMIYINSVLRFCFTAVMFSSVISATFLEFLLVSIYSSGSVVEFYMLCSCMQQLQDASTEITDEAFHEKWYQFSPSIKRTFMLMILSSNLGCKLSTCDKFNLSLSSFMTILNQSYSIAVVLL